jgi:hypothetical protein
METFWLIGVVFLSKMSFPNRSGLRIDCFRGSRFWQRARGSWCNAYPGCFGY